MRITVAPAIISILGFFVMLPLAYYFVFELDYGIYGLGIANFAQYAFQMIATAIYIKLKDDLK